MNTNNAKISNVTNDELVAMSDNKTIVGFATELFERYEAYVKENHSNWDTNTHFDAIGNLQHLIEIIEDDEYSSADVRSGEDSRYVESVNEVIDTLNKM